MRLSRNPWLWRAGIVLAVVAAAVWVARVSLSIAAESANPNLALRFAPFNAGALERKAEAAVEAGLSPEQLRLARDYAVAALERSPTSVRALRVLAITEAARGEEDRAEQLMMLSRRLSRRDLQTTLYFIETGVNAEDPDLALRNFDIALRTSRGSFDLLFPVLTGALTDDRLIAAFDRLAASDPPWFYAFAGSATSEPQAALNLSRILRNHPKSSAALHPTVQRTLLNALVNDGRYLEAERFFRTVVEASGDSLENVRDTRFRDASHIPPFQWSFSTDPDFGAAADRDGGLSFYSVNGRSEVARQLLTLPPGRFVLQTQGGFETGAAPDRAVWRLACAGSEKELGSTALTAGAGSVTRSQAVVEVPAQHCPAQWLTLQLGVASGEATGFVEEVNIVAQGDRTARRAEQKRGVRVGAAAELAIVLGPGVSRGNWLT